MIKLLNKADLKGMNVGAHQGKGRWGNHMKKRLTRTEKEEALECNFQWDKCIDLKCISTYRSRKRMGNVHLQG